MPPLFANSLDALGQLRAQRQGMADSRLFNSLAANRATTQQNLAGRQMANSDMFRLAGLMAGARDSRVNRADRLKAMDMRARTGARTEEGLNKRAHLNALSNVLSSRIGTEGRLKAAQLGHERGSQDDAMKGLLEHVDMGGLPEEFIQAAGPDLFPENAAAIGQARLGAYRRSEQLKNEAANNVAESANTALKRIDSVVKAVENMSDEELENDVDGKVLTSLAAENFILPPDGLNMMLDAKDKREAFRNMKAGIVDQYEAAYPGQISFQANPDGGGEFVAAQWKKFDPSARRSPVDTAKEKAKEIAPPKDQGAARREAMGMTEEQVRYMLNRKLGMTTDPAKIQAIIERAKLFGVDEGVN